MLYTKKNLPETDIAPENKVSQKERSFHTTIFQGRTVSFWEGKFSNKSRGHSAKGTTEGSQLCVVASSLHRPSGKVDEF